VRSLVGCIDIGRDWSTLTRPGGYQAWAVWNIRGLIAYSPAATYSQYRVLAGNNVKFFKGASLTIGAKPILFEDHAMP
jgi:hypothetical protein